MIVQCCAERLSEANRHDLFPLHRTGLKKAVEKFFIDPIDTGLGDLAISAVTKETQTPTPEETVGDYTPANLGSGVWLEEGPGGTVSVFGEEHFGSTGTYML